MLREILADCTDFLLSWRKPIRMALRVGTTLICEIMEESV